MNQTNLGAMSGGVFPAHSTSVEKTSTNDTVNKRSTSDRSDFKVNMAAANKETDNSKRQASAAHQTRDGKPDDSALNPSSRSSEEAGADGNDVGGESELSSTYLEPAVEPSLALGLINPASITVDGALTRTMASPMASPMASILDSSDSIGLVPLDSVPSPQVVSNTFTSVDSGSPLANMQTLPSAITKTLIAEQQMSPSANNASPSVLASLVGSTSLPSNQLFNKLLADNAGSSTVHRVDSEAFDIASAMSKEFDKGQLSSVFVTPLMASKLSADLIPSTPLSLNTSFQSAGQWGQAVTDKVMWMSSKGIKEATIQLDPPELGALQVKVSVNQDQAQVSFTVQHASVREALDQQSMRLREMFAEEGLNLADVDVSDQSQQEDTPSEQDSHRSPQESSMVDGVEVHTTPLYSSSQSYSLVDAYI
ncbi:MAG: flagellar hook-length control protein FliK [Candidatus Endobugula sp.]|jgi:flagellar hook-length control protein FliK